eukprot:6195170-Pleurochrysis_carterae.AAC.3
MPSGGQAQREARTQNARMYGRQKEETMRRPNRTLLLLWRSLKVRHTSIRPEPRSCATCARLSIAPVGVRVPCAFDLCLACTSMPALDACSCQRWHRSRSCALSCVRLA